MSKFKQTSMRCSAIVKLLLFLGFLDRFSTLGQEDKTCEKGQKETLEGNVFHCAAFSFPLTEERRRQRNLFL